MSQSELLNGLKATRDALLDAFDTPQSDLGKSYAPGKWTVRELLVHLADCEAVLLWRLMRVVSEPGSRVEGFDQDAWASALDYDSRSLPLCRDFIAAARANMMAIVERMPATVLKQEVIHSEAGHITGQVLIQHIVNHTRHHLDQIAAAREGREWKAPQ